MPKAVLVMDMPDYCNDCYARHMSQSGRFCRAAKEYLQPKAKRPEMIDSNFNIQFHFAVFHFRWRWIHMKRAKKPTREQKELIAKQGLLPKNWMVILDDKKEMEIVSRKSRQHRVIKKVTG